MAAIGTAITLALATQAHGQGFSTSLIYPTGHPYTPSGADPTVDMVVSNVSATIGKTYAIWRKGTALCYGTKTTSGSWSVDSSLTGINLWNAALAIQASGEVPHIAYMDVGSGTAFSYRTKSGGSWVTEAILTQAPADEYWVRSVSIALDNSSVPRVLLSYSVVHNSVWTSNLILATRTGANAWSMDTVTSNSTGTVYKRVRLRMQSATPHISYNEEINDAPGPFKYATKSGSWSIEGVNQGYFGDLAFTNLPVAAYYDTTGGLSFAYRNGTNGWVATSLGPIFNGQLSITSVGSTVLIAMLSADGDSIRVASKPSTDGWNFQRVSTWPAYSYPYAYPVDHQSFVVGGYSSSGTTKAHIAYFNPVSEYRLAKGTLETTLNNVVAEGEGEAEQAVESSSGIGISAITSRPKTSAVPHS